MTKVKENLGNHNIFQRMEILWKSLTDKESMTKEQIESYEQIDRDVHRLCVNAENNIKLFHHRKYV